MLENGKYYVGDLCYLFGGDTPFPDDAWMSLLKETNYLGGDSGERGGYFKDANGHKFFSSSTQYGDGCYEDQYGRTYGVDAGLIGCFPVAAFPEGFDLDKLRGLGQIVKFELPFECLPADESGNIEIGHLVIETGHADDANEEYEEEEDDNDHSDEEEDEDEQ